MDEYISSREYAVIEWIMRKISKYDSTKTPEKQDYEDVRWRLNVQDTGTNARGHATTAQVVDMNYVVINSMDIPKLATYVSRYTKEFRISDEIVRNMLRSLQKRTLTTNTYIPPFTPDEHKPDWGLPAFVTKTISALEEHIGLTKDDRKIWIAVELVRHNPDELVRSMVRESVQHRHTRERRVLLGMTHKKQPHLFQDMQLVRIPDKVLSQVNTIHVDDTMQTALFSQTRKDERAAFSLDVDRQQLSHVIDEDIERHFFRNHFKECGMEPDEWNDWYPERMDERIREVRGYYSASRPASAIMVPHSRGSDYRVEGRPQYAELDQSLKYPKQFLESSKESCAVLESQFGSGDKTNSVTGSKHTSPIPSIEVALQDMEGEDDMAETAVMTMTTTTTVSEITTLHQEEESVQRVASIPTEEFDFLMIEDGDDDQ